MHRCRDESEDFTRLPSFVSFKQHQDLLPVSGQRPAFFIGVLGHDFDIISDSCEDHVSASGQEFAAAKFSFLCLGVTFIVTRLCRGETSSFWKPAARTVSSCAGKFTEADLWMSATIAP